jgi:hypothetical protein
VIFLSPRLSVYVATSPNSGRVVCRLVFEDLLQRRSRSETESRTRLSRRDLIYLTSQCLRAIYCHLLRRRSNSCRIRRIPSFQASRKVRRLKGLRLSGPCLPVIAKTTAPVARTRHYRASCNEKPRHCRWLRHLPSSEERHPPRLTVSRYPARRIRRPLHPHRQVRQLPTRDCRWLGLLYLFFGTRYCSLSFRWDHQLYRLLEICHLKSWVHL